MTFIVSAVLAATIFLAAPAAESTPATPGHTVLMNRAVKAFHAADHENAMRLFREVLERTPDHAEAWYGLSMSAERAKRLDDAISAAERVQELGFVRTSRMSYRLARLHARAGHTEQSLDWLQRSLAERYEQRPSISTDEGFASLRTNPRFRRLAGMLPESSVSRESGWQFDVDYLVEEARRMHADPARPAFADAFGKEAAALRQAIPDLTDDEIFIRLMGLVAILNDGHSAIYGPDNDSKRAINRRVLPFKFYWFPEGLYIVDGIGAHANRVGHRVVRFGDLNADEVMKRLSRYRGVDNPATWRWMGPQFYVGRIGLLKHIGASKSDSTVDLTLEAPDGKQSTITVDGGDHKIQRKLRPSPGAEGEVPLYLSRVDTNFWMKPLPTQRALYFQFNQVRDAEDENIVDFAVRLRTALAAEDVDNLIVDVRHNNGGNNGLVLPLVRVLVAFEMSDPAHRIFVITGRNTFSAAQNFINRVERWTNAKFAGEPSSSSPNFTGEETTLLLPYSRIRGSISTRYWQDSDPGDDRAFIALDMPVALRVTEYMTQQDPALTAILRELDPKIEASNP